MKSILIGLGTALLLVTVIALGSQKQDQVERQLKSAMNTELVDGNLKAAIEQYKKVADSGNRPLAAQALIHMAECYQNLRDAESQKIYQRIVNDYKDQKDAFALAQARLGGSAVAGTKGDRTVWAGPNVDLYGRVSPDGKFITYVNWDTGQLMIHDVTASADRALTPAAPNVSQQAESSVITKDGKQVVYTWSQEKDWSLRTVALQGSGFPEPRQLFLNKDGKISSFDLSPDGKWIAAAINHRGGPRQLVLISLADGSLRVLKSLNSYLWQWEIFFSPDSRYIAYASTDANQQRDVFVLAIDGSGDIAAGIHSASEVMGWSTDGKRVLFSNDQGGSAGLWALRIADGKVQGTPELLKPDIGSSVSSLGITASGTLVVYKTISTRDIVISPIDLAAGKLIGPPVSFTQGFLDRPRNPVWSRDGKYLAYAACGNSCIGIRTVATGQVRKLQPSLHDINTPSWSPDGHSLLAGGKDVSGRSGAFVRIDVQSGETTALDLGDVVNGQVQWSRDGKIKVYFTRGGVFVERDLASGTERVVYSDSGPSNGIFSPDGQYFAMGRQDPTTKMAVLRIVPLAGGPPHDLLESLHLVPAEWSGTTRVWTPDSTAVIIVENNGTKQELWLAPIAGSPPRKLDIDPSLWTEGAEGGHPADQTFSISPDGRSFAFHMGMVVREAWALENFLPAPTAKK